VGIVGTTEKYLIETSIFTGDPQDVVGVDLASTGILEAWTVSTAIILTLIASGGNLEDLNQGELAAYFETARSLTDI